MYINFERLYKTGYSDCDLMVLQKIAQGDKHLIHPDNEVVIDRFIEDGLVQLVKTGETKFDKLRISVKGKQFLIDICQKELTDEVITLENELIELYKTYNKPIGLKNDVRARLCWFIGETGFRPDIIKKYVEEYLQDADPEYTMQLANLIWKPQSVAFSVNFNLKTSKLFDIISDKMRLQREVFLEKKDKELEYLLQYGSVRPSKRLSKELYYTGSYEGDLKHFLTLAEKLTSRVCL